VHASDPHWVVDTPEPGERLHARVRYHAEDLPAVVTEVHAGGFSVAFEQPARAPAPGQALVLYRGDEVVGGGTLDTSER
jgi:tRNA-uridine 2-sulfurtransferase